jgi:hypothetical protein
MRLLAALILTTVLVLAGGVVTPTDTEARAPQQVKRWRCVFTASKPTIGCEGGGHGCDTWLVAAADIDCGPRTRFDLVRIKVMKATPRGRPDRTIVAHTQRGVTWARPHGLWTVLEHHCPDGAFLPGKLYTRGVLKKRGKPGKVVVDSPLTPRGRYQCESLP